MRISLNDLSGLHFDVAVIGAGINGCAAAQELAGGGYSVLLVDKGDFGAGSSSRSTRLLHCGLRYLAPGGSPYRWIVHPGKLMAAISLTKAAMRAREEFVLNAPRRARKMTFGFPVWKGMQYRPWHVDLGLRVVEAFASAAVPLDRSFVARDAVGSEPLYCDLRDRNRLIGVNVYTEYQFDWPERVAMDMVRDATRLGALCRNYTPVVGLARSGKGWRLCLSNARATTGEVQVEARVVLNTAGIWIDRVNGLANDSSARKIFGTKGAHIVVRLPEECRERGIISFNRAGTEPIYLVPWRQGLHYMGVTETVYEGDIDDVRTDDEDVEWLLGELNSLLPSLRVRRRDILYSWAGVRPLTHDPAYPKGSRSREIHDLGSEGMSGMLALTGGSVATHRSAGRALLAAVRSRVSPSGSPSAPSYAAHHAPGREGSPALQNDDDRVRIADLRDAAEHEQVTSLVDLLARRTGVVWTERQGREAARAAADAVADLLDWDEARIDREVEGYQAYLAHTHGSGRASSTLAPRES